MSVAKCSISDRWTVESGDYYLGNKYHPVAVVVPSKNDIGKKLIKVAISEGVAIAGFCQTANIGIEKVIINVLANPNIRYLVIVGHESKGHRSGEALYYLWKYGVDPVTKRILNCRAPTSYLPNLPIEAIERFRKQVTVIPIFTDDKKYIPNTVSKLKVGSREFNVPINIDMSKQYGFTVIDTCVSEELLKFIIHCCIQELENKVTIGINNRYLDVFEVYDLYDKGAFDTKPYIVKIVREEYVPEVRVVASSPIGVFVEAPDLKHGYRAVMELIDKLGIEVPTRHGLTKELQYVTIVYRSIPRFSFDIDEVTDRIVITWMDTSHIPDDYPLKSVEYIRKYCEALINGEAQLEYSYTYGERLRSFFKYEVERFREEVYDRLLTKLVENYVMLQEYIPTISDVDYEKLKQPLKDRVLHALISTFTVDQLNKVIQNLVKAPHERFHIVCYWNAVTDTRLDVHHPCFVVTQFMIRNSRLVTCHYIRSHDFENAHIHNAYGVSAIANYVVWKLKRLNPQQFSDLDVGELVYVVGSCHKYIIKRC